MKMPESLVKQAISVNAKGEKMNKHELAEAAEVVENGLKYGFGNMLIASELEKGYRLADPAIDTWFNHTEFFNPIISINGNKVRIVAIMSKEPHTGAFRRLVDNIINSGLIPIVVAPIGIMVAIMTYWGWQRRITGNTFKTQEDIYIPSSKWMKGRKDG